MSVFDLEQRIVQNGAMPLEDYYTAAETAKKLGVKKITVQKLIERGLLKADLVGKMYFIHKDEVNRYQQERKEVGRPRRKRKYTKKDDS